MLDQEAITQQLDLLAAHRRTLAHLLRQAAAYGGVIFAPPQTANGIAESRAEIQRMKVALRAGGVPVEDAPNDEGSPHGEPPQAQQAGGDQISAHGQGSIGQATGPVSQNFGEQRNINTGGDYAGGNIDKRQGGPFVEGDVYGNVIGQQVVHQSAASSVTEADYRALLAQLWSNARGKLKYADIQRLQAEQARVELSPQRVQQLENEVRAILAEERFNDIPQTAFECGSVFSIDYTRNTKPQIYLQPFIPSSEVMVEIGRCVLLHEDTTLRLLLQKWPSKCPVDMKGFKAAFFSANNSQPGDDHYTRYERFSNSLEAGLAKR